MIGLAITLALLATAAVSVVYTPRDPLEMSIAGRLQGPSAAHPLGTDQFGRDLLSRIMQGAITSLVDRSIQLMRRVQLEPEFTVVGGILRFESMGRLLAERLGAVNVPPADLVQLVGALGAAYLGQRRLGMAQAINA